MLASCSGGSDDAAEPVDDAAESVDEVEPDVSSESDEEEAAPAEPGSDLDDAETVEIAPVAVTGELLAPFDESIDDPTVGTPAPVVSGLDFDATSVTIGAETENPTLVVFLAHWCPACNAELPELVELADAGSFPDGLDVLAVATASTPERDNYPPSEWLDTAGWSLPTMADSAAGDAFVAFGGMSFPYMVVLDADGTVLARKAGVSSGEDTVAFLEQTLATASA